MEVQLKEVHSLEELALIENLYSEAFPENERRTPEGLRHQCLNEKECSVNLIKGGDKVLGLCIFWKLSSFSFVEHMAIFPEMRGMQAGEKTLDILRNLLPAPVILEVEPPEDEMSRRRINFYVRNGFYLHDLIYIQPSYHGEKHGPELRLMTTQAEITNLALSDYVQVIRTKVYGKRDDSEA
jgi:hypothetical protein